MSDSATLHEAADRLFKLAGALQEAKMALLEQARNVRYNADLQERTEARQERLEKETELARDEEGRG